MTGLRSASRRSEAGALIAKFAAGFKARTGTDAASLPLVAPLPMTARRSHRPCGTLVAPIARIGRGKRRAAPPIGRHVASGPIVARSACPAGIRLGGLGGGSAGTAAVLAGRRLVAAGCRGSSTAGSTGGVSRRSRPRLPDPLDHRRLAAISAGARSMTGRSSPCAGMGRNAPFERVEAAGDRRDRRPGAEDIAVGHPDRIARRAHGARQPFAHAAAIAFGSSSISAISRQIALGAILLAAASPARWRASANSRASIAARASTIGCFPGSSGRSSASFSRPLQPVAARHRPGGRRHRPRQARDAARCFQAASRIFEARLMIALAREESRAASVAAGTRPGASLTASSASARASSGLRRFELECRAR